MNLHKQLLSFLQSQKKSVNEYTELEWIGNEENCYIFFPLVTNGKDIVELEYEAQFTRTDVLQAEGKNGDPYFFMGLQANSVWYAGCGGYGNSSVKADTEWHHFRLVSYGDDNGFWLDGTRIYQSTPSTSAYLPQGFKLWISQGGSRTTYNRKKYVKVKVNGQLVYDLIPVLNKKLTPCLYDKLTGKYFYNEGNGEFTWKLPNQLDYLESTGTQYIDTGFNGYATIELKAQGAETATESQIVVGATSAGGNFFGAYTSTNKWGIGSGTGISNLAYTDIGTFTIYFKNNKSSFDLNGVNYARGDNLTVNTDYNYYLFRCFGLGASSYYAKARIFYCKIWDENNKLVRYLIPVFNEDLTPCMYDLVEKKYYYNEGTGQFKGCFEDGTQIVSYLESNGNQYIETGLTISPTIGFFGEAKASLTDASFETLAGYDTYFLPFAVVPSSKRICMGYGDNTNAPTLYPLTDGRLIPSTETSGIDTNLFIKHTGRFKVGLNFKGSKLWQFEDNSIKYEIDLPEVLPEDKEHTITVFGRKYDDNITNRFMWRGPIYKAIFTDGERVIMNLVPVVKSDNTVCMLDLVRKKYFVNKGTGTFNYG